MKEKLKKCKSMYWIILFLGFTTCIYAPLELYAINREDLWFSLKNMWYIPFTCGAVAMFVAAGIGIFLKDTFRKLYEGILFGFGISAWIQGNFLSLKLGIMTGEAIEWKNYQIRMWLDLLVWLVLIIFFMLWNVKSKKYAGKVLPGIALLLTLMQAVTMIIIMIPCLSENKTSEYGYPTEKYLTNLSPDKNVIVFVLDKYDEEFFCELVEKEPELKEQLDGFIHYANITGGHSGTRYAIPFLLSGDYCKHADVETWKDISCKEKVYWDAILENGYEMSVYSRWSDIPARCGENSINFERTTHSIANHKLFTVALYRLVMCKYFPDIVKPIVWLYGYEFDDRKQLDSEYHDWNVSNLALTDYLMKNSVIADMEKPQYKFIHVSGAHEPFTIDKDGNRIKGISDQETVIRGSMKLVLKYLDEMKLLGIYDSSAIIITADHGNWSTNPSNPIFLVKPFDNRGILEENRAPISHKDFGPTVLDLMGLHEESVKFGVSALDVREGDVRDRLFYLTVSDGHDVMGNSLYKLVEYKADSLGNSADHFYKTGVEYGMEESKD